MKILLLLGQSGVGKTSIAKELCKDSRYNFIDSFTDRPKRNKKEWGHIFVNIDYMDVMLKDPTLVAKTFIHEHRYCALEYQFVEDKINIYIVDLDGLNDVIHHFPHADIMTVLITKDNFTIDDDLRTNRDISLPCREDVDFLINNDTTITSAAGTINVLVSHDWFRKPSHKAKTIEDALEDVYEARRYLDEVNASLQFQRWNRDKKIYFQLIDYLSKQEYTYDIKIVRDDEPLLDDESCPYYIYALYKEEKLQWTDTDTIYHEITKYIHDFNEENRLDKFYWRCDIKVVWEEDFIGW